MYMSNLTLNDLIPMEAKDVNVRKAQKRIIIGHNVGFDRSFIREQYFLEVKKSDFKTQLRHKPILFISN